MTLDFARRPAFWIGALPLGGLLATATFGNGGWLELRRLDRECRELKGDVFRRIHDNDTLRQKITLLRRSDRELERLARQQLGLVRDGEIVYRFRSRGEEPSGRAD